MAWPAAKNVEPPPWTSWRTSPLGPVAIGCGEPPGVAVAMPVWVPSKRWWPPSRGAMAWMCLRVGGGCAIPAGSGWGGRGGDAGVGAQQEMVAPIAGGDGVDVLEVGLELRNPGRLRLGGRGQRDHDCPPALGAAGRAAGSQENDCRQGRQEAGQATAKHA